MRTITGEPIRPIGAIFYTYHRPDSVSSGPPMFTRHKCRVEEHLQIHVSPSGKEVEEVWGERFSVLDSEEFPAVGYVPEFSRVYDTCYVPPEELLAFFPPIYRTIYESGNFQKLQTIWPDGSVTGWQGDMGAS